MSDTYEGEELPEVVPESKFSRGHDGEVFDLNGARLDQDSLDELLEWSRGKKASDITLSSGDHVWAEIGGRQIRITRKRISHPEVSSVLRSIYGDNGPGMVNAGTALDFAYDVKRPKGRMRFRMNASCGRVPGARGFQITIRNLPTQPLTLEELGGIEPEITENLRPPTGLNLITGPTGSGKSTLMSSLIRWRCEQEGADEKIVEYSAPIEYVYDGLFFPDSHIFQAEPGDHLRPTEIQMEEGGSLWSQCVTNALRRAPKIIVIGEARDKATIENCIKASLTGHLVMSTMHTIGVPESMRAAMMRFPGSERRAIAADLLETLNLVVTQLLLPQVGGGKVGCREFLVFDRKVRTSLVNMDPDKWPSRLREMLTARQVVGCSMADSARNLLNAGRITPETYEWIAARTSAESKVTRTVHSGRMFDGSGEAEG